jgi:hypothetical protein
MSIIVVIIRHLARLYQQKYAALDALKKWPAQQAFSEAL